MSGTGDLTPRDAIGQLLDYPGLLERLAQVEDFREEALKHVIESLDTELFERVSGLTVEDFAQLSRLGLFNVQNMNAAIWQFRAFERASLHYADGSTEAQTERVGLWDTTVELASP